MDELGTKRQRIRGKTSLPQFAVKGVRRDITVYLRLASGHSIHISIFADDSVSTLITRSKRMFNLPIARLIMPCGAMLNPSTSLNKNGIVHGQELTAVVIMPRIFSTQTAFAFLKNDGSVVTWGHSRAGGGDSTSVRAQLQGEIKQVFGTASAFAALKNDGSVVTWGENN